MMKPMLALMPIRLQKRHKCPSSTVGFRIGILKGVAVGLSEALQAAGEGRLRKGPRCTVGVLLDSLNNQDKEALVAALANKQVSGASLSVLLNDYGFSIGAFTINNHRRSATGTGCACNR